VPVAEVTSEHLVRMGEIVVSAAAGDVLACVGLGSCIGLALIDRRASVAGLAHIMLPAAPPNTVPSGRHADFAVPALYEEVLAAGAQRHRLDAVLVGGAAMFSFGASGQEIGERNESAVRALVDELRLRVRAQATGGTKGRTMRVHVDDGRVIYKEAGGPPTELLSP
jgi:chemotaxis protein CheD